MERTEPAPGPVPRFLVLAVAILVPAGLVAQDATGPESVTTGVDRGHGQVVEGAVQEDDWDWDWEETTVQPAFREDAGKADQAAAHTKEGPPAPRRGETAEPDFARTAASGHVLFEGVPGFGVIPSKKDSEMHPCANCHAWAVSKREPRRLLEPHDNFLLQHGLHGRGEFWCFTCHHLDGNGGIQTLEGEQLDFDEAYVICAQCHPREARDWSFGAHGKRVETWSGKRRILNCTACHYQHNPAIKPRTAQPPPPLRRGLAHAPHEPVPEQPLWKRIEERYRLMNGTPDP